MLENLKSNKTIGLLILLLSAGPWIVEKILGWSLIFDYVNIILSDIARFTQPNLPFYSAVGMAIFIFVMVLAYWINRFIPSQFMERTQIVSSMILAICAALFISSAWITGTRVLKVAFFYYPGSSSWQVAYDAAELALEIENEDLVERKEDRIKIFPIPFQKSLETKYKSFLGSGDVFAAISLISNPLALLEQLDSLNILSRVIFISAMPTQPELNSKFFTFSSVTVLLSDQYIELAQIARAKHLKSILIVNAQPYSGISRATNELETILRGISITPIYAPIASDYSKDDITSLVREVKKQRGVLLLTSPEFAVEFLETIILENYKGVILTTSGTVSNGIIRTITGSDVELYFSAGPHHYSTQSQLLAQRLRYDPLSPIIVNSYLAAGLIRYGVAKSQSIDVERISTEIYTEHPAGFASIGLTRLSFTTQKQLVLRAIIYKISSEGVEISSGS